MGLFSSSKVFKTFVFSVLFTMPLKSWGVTHPFADVDTTTISLNNGDLLQWNGVEWVGVPVPNIVSTDVGATAKITNAVAVNFNSTTTMVDKALGTTTFNEFNTDVSTDGTGFVINTAGTYRVIIQPC